MALDAQSNWNVEMSQPLRIASIPKDEPPDSKLLEAQSQFRSFTREVPLPAEIISQILSYIPRRANTQSTFWSCTLLSRVWYECSIAILYERPYVNGSNFDLFVRTACPSKNAHIRDSPLAALVRRLDMGELVHSSSRSLTARLLGRLKGNLREFVAPQASFAINSIAPLSKCSKLQYLDLSLISASIPRKVFFHTLQALTNLETLFFPRSSSPHDPAYNPSARDEIEPYTWPPRLKVLHLAGGIDDFFLLHHLVHIPASLERLSIQHCQQVHATALLDVLQIIGPQLQHLTIRHPMSKLQVGVLDELLAICSNLLALRISADYISSTLFEQIPKYHPLRILDLDCSGTAGTDVQIEPMDVICAIIGNQLSNLRSVRVSARLAWEATQRSREKAEELADWLEFQEREEPLGMETGVWSFMD